MAGCLIHVFQKDINPIAQGRIRSIFYSNAKISWEVVKEAKLTQFDCALGTHGGQTSLIFNVGIENTSNTALRYRVNIFLEDMDKAAGHLVPRKGKPPVLEPGKSASVKIPFIGTDQESKKILVVVKTISTD